MTLFRVRCGKHDRWKLSYLATSNTVLLGLTFERFASSRQYLAPLHSSPLPNIQ